MNNDLIPFAHEDPGHPDRAPNRGSYPQPAWITQAGQVDRRNEATHVVAVRQLMREAELARIEVAKQLSHDLDQIEADARKVTEQKFRLQRAQKESQILAGDDPELRAKFAVLDDDLFARYRQMGMGGRS